MRKKISETRKFPKGEMVKLAAWCIAIIQRSSPEKSKNRGSFTIPITIG